MRSLGSLAQLERQLKEAKQAYANAMSSLDNISKEIHMKRAQSAASLAAAEEHAAAAAPGPQGGAAVGAVEEKT
jgi:ribosomal protein L1